MFSTKADKICKLKNRRAILPVMLLEKSVCKISHFLYGLFILAAIVQGTSFNSGNLNLSVTVVKRTNPTTDGSTPIAFKKQRVIMQHQPDWVTKLEDTVEKAKELNLSNKNLEELPACLKRAEELKELDISENRLKAVSLKFLVANKGLEKLNISGNRRVAFLDEGYTLKGLKCLIAESCGWKVIPASISQFSQLEELYLGGNLLESFDPDFFLNLPSLKILDLNVNRRITFGSQPWTNLKNLRRLVLFDMGLDEIPYGIGTLKNLTSLDVCCNKIKRIDAEMFLKLGCLEELDIGNNKKLVIDEPAWESLKDLRSLNIEGLGMTEIPIGLKKLTKLQKLYLGDNRISVLNPADFAGLSDLEHLEFNSGRLRFEVVTTGWNQLKSLKKLNINGSTLEELGDWVKELQSLEELNLSWNWIQKLNDEFFDSLSKLPKLRILNLEFNALNTLPTSILLLKNKNVKILLEGNDIEIEPSETNVGCEILEKEFGENIVFYND